jgi:delta 1-pyrroline-5-carboxylate dehydrogenase
MPLTVAALSGSSPASGVPYYPQQQHQMMHQQHMMMMQQQQQQQMQHQQQLQQQQQQQQQQHLKLSASTVDTTTGITTGVQCDFCGGDEQENKTTKLPEQMITCKVFSMNYYLKHFSNRIYFIFLGLWWFCTSNLS